MADSTFATDAAAFRGGVRDALGVPAAVLTAGYLGYGSLAAEHGYSIAQIVFATAAIWALPGQLILVEMNAIGASAIAIVAAVAISSARFLPMTVSMMPVIRDRRYGLWIFAVAQLVSMTNWAGAMRRCPDLPPGQRMPYFTGFGATCMVVSAASAAAGHGLAGAFPPLVRLGFVFLAPVYFLVILVGEVRTRLAATALACGAVAGPLFHIATPQWSVLLAGFAGGTAAYYIIRSGRGQRRA